MTTSDLIVGIISAGYGASRGQMLKKIREVRDKRENLFVEVRDKHRFYNVLSKLKKEGFIKSEGNNKWLLTQIGRKKVEAIRGARKTEYPKAKQGDLKIITFDIPETKRIERNWLRDSIRGLGFQMLQKSVWIGRCDLPEELLEDIKKNGIFDCVHIIQITKTGTILGLE